MSNGNHSAFPGTRFSDDANHAQVTMPGLTKREYFAGLAMQGWISASPQVAGINLTGTDEHAAGLAEVCVMYADALLAELAKSP